MAWRALPFSSICITQNGQAPPHRDRNNSGMSSIVTCGTFRGGELLAEKEGGHKFIPIDGKASVSADAVQCRGSWNYFSAQRWHMVLPFRGERISVALYCCRNLGRLSRQEHARLVQLGFVLPPEHDNDAYSPCPPDLIDDLAGATHRVTAADGGHSDEDELHGLISADLEDLLKETQSEADARPTSRRAQDVTPCASSQRSLFLAHGLRHHASSATG
eukprot:5411297-Amphidinium_carterae.2